MLISASLLAILQSLDEDLENVIINKIAPANLRQHIELAKHPAKHSEIKEYKQA